MLFASLLRPFSAKTRRAGGHPALVISIAMFVLILLGVATAIILWSLRQQNLAIVEARLVSITRLLEEQTRSNILSVDLILKMIAEESLSNLPDHDARYEDWLRRRLDNLPHVRAFYLIDQNGTITQDTDYPATASHNLADRDYFVFHQNDPSGRLYVAAPQLSRSIGRSFVAVSRRIENVDGSFAGVAVAAVEPIFFKNLYSDLMLEASDVIALWHDNGQLVARMPTQSDIVLPEFHTDFPADLRTDERGVFEDSFSPHRLVSFNRVRSLPLVVTGSTDIRASLSSWRRLVEISLLIFILLAAMAIVLPLLAYRNFQERRALEQRSLLLQKSEALGRMTSGVAHDFRNLLATIESGLNMIERRVDTHSKIAPTLEATRDAIRRGADLSSQLMGFARNREFELVALDINELIHKLQPVLKQAAGPDVRMHFNLEDDLLPCLVDPAQFDAAILNLVVNARDAMATGGVVTITSSSWLQTRPTPLLSRGRYIRLSIADTGPGIPSGFSTMVFEPFFTTKGEEGTGLGLSQVFNFMQLLHGEARIVAKADTGAIIELFFPCAISGTTFASKENIKRENKEEPAEIT